MRHRHLEVGPGQWSIAVVDSILERGGASDVVGLLAELRRDAHGPAARAAEASARHSDVYGYPELILACLETWRSAEEAIEPATPLRVGQALQFFQPIEVRVGETAALDLGNFTGVETPLRQLVRSRPLETEPMAIPGVPLRVPTVAEMLRLTGWAIVFRNAARDYVSFAAFARRMGPRSFRAAFREFDDFHRDSYRPESGRDVSPMLQLVRQLAAPLPHDLEAVKLASHRWDDTAAECRYAATVLTEGLLSP